MIYPIQQIAAMRVYVGISDDSTGGAYYALNEVKLCKEATTKRDTNAHHQRDSERKRDSVCAGTGRVSLKPAGLSHISKRLNIYLLAQFRGQLEAGGGACASPD